jgi:hypothetical protein
MSFANGRKRRVATDWLCREERAAEASPLEAKNIVVMMTATRNIRRIVRSYLSGILAAWAILSA